MAKLVLMLRIKDGMFFLKDWLDRYEPLVDEIVALDNGSTDGTLEMLQKHPKVVEVLQTVGYNEGRDKNMLYQHMRLRKPDWCMWLDVDEIFEPELTREVLDKMMAASHIDRYAFRRFHFTDREHFAGSWYWLDYSAGHDRLLWREKSTGYFADLLMDSPNIKGIGGIKVYTSWRLKHLGYINKTLVNQKAALYRSMFAKDDQTQINAMYLHGERKIKWYDGHNNIKVIKMNMLLDTLLLRQFVVKAFKLAFKPVASVIKKLRTPQAAVSKQPIPVVNTNVYEQDRKNIQL
jgi:glycosyltransferase involved in cell wall biosynthesis